MMSVLYAAPTEDLILIDIPTSIAEAHGFRHNAQEGQEPEAVKRLLSKLSLSEPYPSTEPKSERARQKIAEQSRTSPYTTALAKEYQNLLRDALTILRGCHSGEWCLPREVAAAEQYETRRNLRRRRNRRSVTPLSELQGSRSQSVDKVELHDGTLVAKTFLSVQSTESGHSPGNAHDNGSMMDSDEDDNPVIDQVTSLLTSMIHRPVNSMRFVCYIEPLGGINKADMQLQIREQSLPTQEAPDLISDIFHNPLMSTQRLVIIDNESSETSTPLIFYLPPDSTVLLSRIDNPLSLRNAVRQTFTSPRQNFNFLLLDPPWPNRSVKRSTPYASSNTKTHLGDLKRMLIATDLETYLAPGGYIAMWITNKPAVRDAVLGTKGLFARWNVQLVEEWIYLKIAGNGEPVTALDGVWRKPYEVLLIGRAPADVMRLVSPVQVDALGVSIVPKRRVIAAVPDLHSRKPCLKGLIERWLGFEAGQYEALELFSRYAVSGWWTWGDEAMKFSHTDHWDDSQSAPIP